MKTLKRILVTALIAITVIACTDKKEDYPEQLPKATQTGENTAGCYVNGKLWIMRGKSGGITNSGYEAAIVREPIKIDSTYVVSITIKDLFYDERSSDNTYVKSAIEIYIKTLTPPKEGSYVLSKLLANDSTKGSGDGFFSIYDSENKNFYGLDTDLKNTGTLTITKLVTTGKKPFIAGTFKFTVTASTGEVFKITNGRFDLELNKILQ